jgi:guanylate kinase
MLNLKDTMTTRELTPLLSGQSAPPLLVVISGPSGVGKDSVLMRMRELAFPFHFVVTANSRPMRPGEIDGYDYHFVTTERFEAMIRNNELLEWAEVYGQYKGIPKWEVRQAMESGRDVILRINVDGAATLKQIAPEAVFIFLAPANMDELRRRLTLRRTESGREIETRLDVAAHELEQARNFDYVVINHEARLDEAVGQVRAIITAEKQRVYPRRVEL